MPEPDLQPGQNPLTCEWRPFALKDVRALVDAGVLTGPVTRLRERLSKAGSLFSLLRLGLWKSETGGVPLALFVFWPEFENPRHVRLFMHFASDAGSPAQKIPASVAELRKYFLEQDFWRISYYEPCADANANASATAGRSWLEALGFEKECRLSHFFLDERAPSDAQLWSWKAEKTDPEVFFLPFGDGALCVTGDADAVSRIEFFSEHESIASSLVFLHAYQQGWADKAGRLSHPTQLARPSLSPNMLLAYQELERYLAGSLKHFSFKLKTPYGSPFQEAVWELLRQLPYGSTCSYLELARHLCESDETRAHRLCRAVGAACSANPLCIVYPCHRVIGNDNSLTGYNGGVHFKAKLLDLELLVHHDED